MSETYIVNAKTVEEAVSIANSKYADENHEVSYEILEMPKKGFLGIGAKDASIKVTVTETKAVELGSLVRDIRSMKSLTDRGNDEKSQKKDQSKDSKQNQTKQENKQNKPAEQKNNKQSQNKNNNNKQQSKQQNNKQENKPAQKQENKQSKPAEVKPAEEKQQNKTRLNNQALPGKRSKQRKPAATDSDISASAVTVNTPANLSEFVSEKPAQNAFGSSERSGGGRMSNDIRRGKKPAQGKPVSTETRDRQMLDSKYDVAESDDDYKNIEKLERESENLLEMEAQTALGFGEKPEEIAEPEVRTREAVTKAEMQFALEFANTLLKNMQIGAEAVPMECPEDEELIVTEAATVYPKINIVGDDSGILIGHHGETLDSIQYLVNLCALRKTKSKDGDYVKIVVDIENYRNKREDTLRALARRMAAKAVKYKRNVFLEPMNAYERRIIHSELQKYQGVSTHSVGSDRDRKIIITYEGEDKAPENKSKRRRSRGKGKSQNKDNKPAQNAEKPAETTSEKPAQAEKKPHRPRKPQKLSIDKLDDLLEGNETVKLEPADEE